MTPFEQLIQSLTTFSFDLWFFVKILFLFGLVIYVAFAVVVVRQVGLMLRALNVELETFLKIVSWLHLLTAIGLFFLALAVL